MVKSNLSCSLILGDCEPWWNEGQQGIIVIIIITIMKDSKVSSSSSSSSSWRTVRYHRHHHILSSSYPVIAFIIISIHHMLNIRLFGLVTSVSWPLGSQAIMMTMRVLLVLMMMMMMITMTMANICLIHWKVKQIYFYQPRRQSTPAYRQGPPQSKRCAGIYSFLVIIVLLS